MNFYTKEWEIFVEKNYKDALINKYNITNKKYIHDKSFTESDITKAYEKYKKNKLKYINNENKLRKLFNNIEEIEPYDDKLEEEQFKIRIKKFINKYKEKTLKEIEFLKENNCDVSNLNIEDVSFNLLAINKVDSKTKSFFEKLIRRYNYYTLQDKIEKENIKDIDYIENDVFKFLTTYEEYLETITDKYDYELLNNIDFHDTAIEKYEINNKNIILETIYADNRIIRFTIDDPKIYAINITKKEEINHNNIKKDTDIDYITYGNYTDIPFYLNIALFETEGEISVEYFSNKIKVETFVINENFEKYIKEYDTYKKNLLTIKKYISNETYKLLQTKSYILSTYISSYEYNNNLTFHYKEFGLERNEINFDIVYENAKVKIYNHNKIISKEDIKNLLVSELIGRNKMSQLKTIINIPLNYSFVEKSGKISVKILIETKDCFIEIEILCTNLYFKFKDSNEVEKRREILLSLFKD